MSTKRIRRTRPSGEGDRASIIASTGGRRRGVDAALSSRLTKEKPEKAAPEAKGRRTKRKGKVIPYRGDGGADQPMSLMLRQMKPVSQQHRDGEYLHVSDVIHKCLRKLALNKRLGLRMPTETIQDGRGVTFAIGDGLHDYVKGRFAEGAPDEAWAKWTCKCGSLEHTGVYADIKGKLCPRCGGQANKHNEVPLRDKEYMLVGNPDLEFLLLDYDAFLITEIKSINKDAWKDLARPLPEHVVQVTFYWYLKKKLGFDVVDRVVILYVNKDFSFKSPYKEFCITPDLDLLEPYFEDIEAYLDAVEDPEAPLPPRIMCGTETAPEAKKCHVCATCFGVD